MGQAQLLVEVRAADVHAAVGQDVLAAIGLAGAAGAQADQREVGGAAADVDDQHQLLAVDLRFIVESRGQRFELELDVGEADLAGDLAQSVLRGLVGGRIVVHEEHRATEHHALEIAAGGGLGAALEFGDEAREQHAERNRTALTSVEPSISELPSRLFIERIRRPS